MHRRDFLTGAATMSAALSATAGRSAAPARPRAGQDTTVAEDENAARQFHAQRRFVETQFGRIAYVEQGHGAAALFLHGFPLNGFQWRGVMERLARHRRCIAPDFMGLGFTRVAWGQGVSPADQVGMLAVLLDRLAIPRVDLIANDSGGSVAQLFSVHHPARVRTLLLTNCDVEFDSPPPALLPVIQLAREGTFPDQLLVPWFADKALARSPQGLGGLCYSRPDRLSDTAIETYLGPLIGSSERKALTNAYILGLTPNPLAGIEQKLRQLQVPTRIVWGESDTIFSAESPAYLDRILPQSRGVRRIPHAKLFFPEEYPELVAEEALGLWRSV